MYRIAHIGNWESLPETAAAIYDHDIPKLQVMIQRGIDLNSPISLSKYTKDVYKRQVLKMELIHLKMQVN